MGAMISVEALELAGAAELCSIAREDSRGWFARFFCEAELDELTGGRPIQQINASFTAEKGAVRGLHFQYPPHAEDKFVRCLRGEVFDVMVDLRRGSATFGKWHAIHLDPAKMNMAFIPQGFAHGFQTLTTDCQLLYLHTECFSPDDQGGLHHASAEIGIDWPLPVTELSERDATLAALESSFEGIEL
ncbi:MAG: dTDP-4-dehydrorhamnose 3,5-epimerase [Candidatus Paceibacteria bacterium]|jgi:dTDP-4-dehydrorhamnose 3,5-epimerase